MAKNKIIQQMQKMLIETFEHKSSDLYDMSAILKTKSQYNIIYGERSNGKSYSVKMYILSEAINKPDTCKFMYLRRRRQDIDNTSVNQYFQDMITNRDGKHPIEELTNGQFNNIFVKSRKIYMERINDEEKQEAVKCIGYVGSLVNCEHMKSLNYDDVENIVFEEFIATGMYLPNEGMLLSNVVSTVLRRREGRVFMIGNTIDANCYYFSFFSLTKIKTQEAGTIDVYHMPTDDHDEDGKPITVKVAVERTDNYSKKSNMVFGQARESVMGGEWESTLQPYVDIKDTDTCIYTVVFKYRIIMFLAECYINNEGCMFWYIRPKKWDVNRYPDYKRLILKGTRVISDEITTDPYYTSSLIALSENEAILFDLFRINRVFFCSNLCGTQFKDALEYFKNNTL